MTHGITGSSYDVFYGGADDGASTNDDDASDDDGGADDVFSSPEQSRWAHWSARGFAGPERPSATKARSKAVKLVFS